MTTFLDTNILISLLDEAHQFHDWSVEKFEECRAAGPTLITDIVYSEFSIGMASKEETDSAIAELAIQRFRANDVALFRAGRAYKQYKEENVGPKTNVLPDFIIGAVAEVAEAPLLTTNRGDFESYFPTISLIAPNDE